MHALPSELTTALSKGGYVLLIKGEAGTGKTTLGLQLLSEVFDGKGVYVSTRVSPEELFTQFPWLKGRLDPSNVIDATEPAIPPAKELDFMRLRISQGLPSFIEGVYVACSEAKARVVVVDSINAIADLPEGEAAPHRLIELSKVMGVSLVITLEGRGASKLDYLADGIVTLQQECYGGRCLRSLRVEKSRMVERKRSAYVFTLKNSRFRHVKPVNPLEVGPDVRSDPGEEDEKFFTTGFKVLDEALGGGFPKGSYNVIEVSVGTPMAASRIFIVPLIRTFIERDRGVLIVLPAGMSSRGAKREFVEAFGREKVEKLIRIFDFNLRESDDPCIVPRGLDDKSESFKVFQRELERLAREHGPILDITTFDIYEQYFGRERAIYNMSRAIAAYRDGGHLGIGVIHSRLRTVTEQKVMSTVYLRVEEKNGVLLLHGVNPWTPFFALEVEQGKKLFKAKLVEIV